MDWLIIEGSLGWDGRYEFDIEGQEFTVREWGWIKRYSGYLPLTVETGFQGADPELITVFAVIAMHRAKRIGPADVQRVIDSLADSPAATTIRLESDEPAVEDDAGPPALSPSSSVNGGSSGAASQTSSETLDAIPPATGTPASATSGSPPVGGWGS